MQTNPCYISLHRGRRERKVSYNRSSHISKINSSKSTNQHNYWMKKVPNIFLCVNVWIPDFDDVKVESNKVASTNKVLLQD